MTLRKIRGNTYYIHGATNVGIYAFKNKNCILIDTGINNTAARRVENILDENGLHPKYIINTHSHLDHCGGNNYFIDNYPGCIVYASEKEKIFMENPDFLPYTLFSSHGLKNMKKGNNPIRVDYNPEYGINKINDEKFEIVALRGHSIEQIGIITPDKVCFLGDSIFSEKILDKYSFPYLYNIEDSLSTLSVIKDVDAEYFVVGHSDQIYEKSEIISLADRNIANIEFYCSQCLTILEQPLTREDLLQNIAILNNLPMDKQQYYLNFAAVSAFISYLYNKGQLDEFIDDGKIYYYNNKN